MIKSKMKVVLVEPEIPFNTGSIGRTCVALDLELILVGKLVFHWTPLQLPAQGRDIGNQCN